MNDPTGSILGRGTRTLAHRTAAAARLLAQAPASAHGRQLGEHLALIRIRVVGLLGLDLADVRPEPDRLSFRTQPGEPVQVIASCPDLSVLVFLYRNPLYDDDPLELIGPCPQCQGQVPLAQIWNLAHLGQELATPPLEDLGDGPLPDRLPPTFPDGPGHTDRCRYGQIP